MCVIHVTICLRLIVSIRDTLQISALRMGDMLGWWGSHGYVYITPIGPVYGGKGGEDGDWRRFAAGPETWRQHQPHPSRTHLVTN